MRTYLISKDKFTWTGSSYRSSGCHHPYIFTVSTDNGVTEADFFSPMVFHERVVDPLLFECLFNEAGKQLSELWLSFLGFNRHVPWVN